MPWRFASVALAVLLLAGCGSSASVRSDVLADVAKIDIASGDDATLKAQIGRAIAQLQDAEPKDARDRRARRLAIAGFRWYRRCVQSRIDFLGKDSGNVAAAERDAEHEYDALKRGATLLDAALRVYGKRLLSR